MARANDVPVPAVLGTLALLCVAPALVPSLVLTAPLTAPLFLALRRQYPVLGRVGGAIAWVGAIYALAVLGTFVLPVWAVALPLMVGGLVVSVGWLTRRVEVLALAVAPTGAIPAAMFAKPLAEVLVGTQHGGSVRSIPDHLDARVYRFEDAALRVDLGATRYKEWTATKNRSSGHRYYHVAPLLPETWAVGEAVPAWAVCSGKEARCPDWQQRPIAAVRVWHAFAGDYTALIAEAEARHGVRSAPGAPQLQLVESRGDWLVEQIALSGVLCGALMFLSIVTAPITATRDGGSTR